LRGALGIVNIAGNIPGDSLWQTLRLLRHFCDCGACTNPGMPVSQSVINWAIEEAPYNGMQAAYTVGQSLRQQL